ncbi:MAG: hypothetical protein ABIR48_05750, partial [Gammaproteobacteria bacterium]
TSNGTAVAGIDYTAVTGTLSWANGDFSARTFSVPLRADGISPEAKEGLTLRLSNPTNGATLSPNATALLEIGAN